MTQIQKYLSIAGIIAIVGLIFWFRSCCIETGIEKGTITANKIWKSQYDSLMASKIYLDTTIAIKSREIQKLEGRKPAVVYVEKPNPITGRIDTTYQLPIDTLLNVKQEDTTASVVIKIPFLGLVKFKQPDNIFAYWFKFGTIEKTITIKQSNVVTLPPPEKTWWENATPYFIGSGIFAMILLALTFVF